MIRWATVSLIAGLLTLGVLYDRATPVLTTEVALESSAVVSPAVSRPGQLTAIWYCPVGSSNPFGFASHEISITNTGDEVSIVNLSVFTDNGASIELRQEIEPLATSKVDLASLGSEELASAMVEIVGGEGIVGHTVSTPHGEATGPCATESASSFYFAGGATTLDSENQLVLMNPFGEDAVVSIELQAGARTRRPTSLRAAVIEGRTSRAFDLTEFIAREEDVSVRVEVTRGRLVAERLQTFDGRLGPSGAALTLGTVSPEEQWFFPAGRIVSGSDHKVVIYNPSSDESAEVDLSFSFDDPDDPSLSGLVPIELSIAAGRAEVVDLLGIALRLNLELPLDVGVIATSADGVGVVAERWQISPQVNRELIGAGGTNARAARLWQTDPEEDQEEHEDVPLGEFEELDGPYLQPNATRGVAVSRGTSQLSTEWLIPSTDLKQDDGTVLAISSIEGATVEVRLLVGGSLQPPIRATVPPGGRTIVSLGGSTDEAAMIVSASAPVAVEVQLVEVASQIDVAGAVPVLVR